MTEETAQQRRERIVRELLEGQELRPKPWPEWAQRWLHRVCMLLGRLHSNRRTL